MICYGTTQSVIFKELVAKSTLWSLFLEEACFGLEAPRYTKMGISAVNIVNCAVQWVSYAMWHV